MVKEAHKSQQRLVLADIPERRRLRQLQAELAELRDHIAAADLEIETLREQLSEFEAYYHAQLRPEHEQVRRIRSWLQHVERWSEILEQQVRAPTPELLVQRIERLEGRRGRELKQQQAAEQQARAAQVKAESTAKTAAQPRAADLAERLKAAYHELARRFHPDLARTEEERLTNSQVMARINNLYRAGDLDRLVALREQARGGELDESQDLSLDEQLTQLQERHAWFVAVEQNLQEERAALEQSATCELWRNVQQAQVGGRDLFEELRQQTQARILRLLEDIPHAARSLENAVNRYNRDLTKQDKPGALELRFDPYEDKSMVRLALDELGQQQVSPAVRKQAREVEQLAQDRPALLRLLLLTYVSELSPLPLAGLERYEDLQLRFATLGAQDEDADEPLWLEAALVESDAWLEFGVRQATAKLAHAGLRFRQKSLRDAIPVALLALPVRRAFKRVLAVLGEHTSCTGCHAQVFAVPLYRTRGLDDLRASVCPRCGTVLNSYWMPRGKDVQAVLNAAFLDFEIVSEFSFTLGRASIAMQLVPQQVETLTVGDIKKRLVQDIFTRHAIEVAATEVQLHQKGKPVRDGTALHRIETPRFAVRFTADAKLSESDALELVRHRIRTRFQA